jgi:hypothetical protein
MKSSVFIFVFGICLMFAGVFWLLTKPVSFSYDTNPDVTPSTIQSTICVPGYTKTVRPPWRYTNKIKEDLLRQRNESLSNKKLYELDHRIPLTAGGSPDSLSNLWLEPWPEAKIKDKDEFHVGRCICEGGMSLAEGQNLMRTWTKPLNKSVYNKCQKEQS